jgi:hypothetical protein
MPLINYTPVWTMGIGGTLGQDVTTRILIPYQRIGSGQAQHSFVEKGLPPTAPLWRRPILAVSIPDLQFPSQKDDMTWHIGMDCEGPE